MSRRCGSDPVGGGRCMEGLAHAVLLRLRRSSREEQAPPLPRPYKTAKQYHSPRGEYHFHTRLVWIVAFATPRVILSGENLSGKGFRSRTRSMGGRHEYAEISRHGKETVYFSFTVLHGSPGMSTPTGLWGAFITCSARFRFAPSLWSGSTSPTILNCRLRSG